jgi:hypothetical protein
MTVRRTAVISRGTDIISEPVDVDESHDDCPKRLHHRDLFDHDDKLR